MPYLWGPLRGQARKTSEFTATALAALPLWDDKLKGTHFEQRSYDYVELRANADAEIRAKWLARYKEYRKTPEWKRKRALILKRDKHQCQGCSTAPATQAHHLTYFHVGEEFLFELVTVCNSCHKRLHDPEEEQVPF